MQETSTRDDDIAKNAYNLYRAKPMASLPDCIDDCKLWLRMLQKDYSIPSSKIALFASKENYDKIIDLKLWTMTSDVHKRWIDLPKGDRNNGFDGVPEDLLAI
jgi:hypothetical protein